MLFVPWEYNKPQLWGKGCGKMSMCFASEEMKLWVLHSE